MRERLRVFRDIERAAWEDLIDATSSAERRRLGLEVRNIDGALALGCPGVDHMMVNRVLGLGTGRPATPGGLDEVLDFFGQAGVGRYLVHVEPDADPTELAGWLEDRGLVRHPRGWIKMERDATARVPAGRSEFTIATVRPQRRDEYGRVLAVAFGLPERLGPIFAAVVGRPGWHAFVALLGSTPVAAAAMFTRGGVAHLTGAATLAAQRGRGAQGALLARRIQVAVALGCRRIHSETGEAAPDRPNHSERNLRRAGFVPAYVRPNYWPSAAALTAA